MVRLECKVQRLLAVIFIVFQFLNGAIRISSRVIHRSSVADFNSSMVRLEYTRFINRLNF